MSVFQVNLGFPPHCMLQKDAIKVFNRMPVMKECICFLTRAWRASEWEEQDKLGSRCSSTPYPSPFSASLTLLNLGQKLETPCRAHKKTKAGDVIELKGRRQNSWPRFRASVVIVLVVGSPFWNICGNRCLGQAVYASSLRVGVSYAAFSGTRVAEVMGHWSNQIYND